MLNFCTLYNSNYSAKGLAMYRSLRRVCPEFHLYVLAMDDAIEQVLREQQLPHVTVIGMREFEDEKLLQVKPTRSVAEYCWTCTASLMMHCLTHFDIDHCSYLDSDVYFYRNPQVLMDEMGDDDVLITPHWFPKDDDNSANVGKYCVQFVTARNTENGRRIINDWRNDCLDWCYSHYDNGKMGDQMYLDSWPEKYKRVCVSSNRGAGVAPWNTKRYEFTKQNDVLYIADKEDGKIFPIVFYHYHFVFSLRMGIIHEFAYDVYNMSRSCYELLYKTYLKDLKKAYRDLKKCNNQIDSLGTKEDSLSWREYWRKRISILRHKDFKHYFWI